MEFFEEERGEAAKGRDVWGGTEEAEGGGGGATGNDAVEVGGEGEGVEDAESGPTARAGRGRRTSLTN